MDEIKLALEVIYIWLFLCTLIGLMAYGFYMFLELWETDRKALLTLMAVIIAGTATGIILALI